MWLIGIRSNRETAMAVGEKSRNVVIIKGTAPKVRPPKLDNSREPLNNPLQAVGYEQ